MRNTSSFFSHARSKRISGRVRFIEGLSPHLQTQGTLDAVGDHPEQQLLA
ncbi:MAG: hypothetical protein ABI887_00065 [Burkholderiales bacterium]